MRVRNILIALCLLVFSVSGAVARAGDEVNIRGILVLASDRPGPPDRKLAQFEPIFKRLRYESFRSVGEGAAQIAVPGSGRIALGHGQSLELDVKEADGGSVRVAVRWLDGPKPLMNAGLVLRRGTPALIGHTPTDSEGEDFGVIVIVN